MLRSVKAQLVERFIFNFRLTPDALADQLPVTWLKPQIFNGWSVASFCILSLGKVTLSWLPSFLGYKTTSCAYRIGVIDTSGASHEPSVYITDRNSDLPLIARLAPFIFADTIPMAQVTLTHSGNLVDVRANYNDRQRLFSAKVEIPQPPKKLDSEIFDSTEDFVKFIKGGVSSYTPSIYGDQLARVDLDKEDANYEPLNATVDFSWLDGAWRDSGLIFDSTIRATGGRYTWRYRGLKSYT